MNACTSKDATSYYATVMDDQVVRAVDVLTDIVCNMAWTEEDFVREKGVILQEILDLQDNTMGWLADRLMEKAFIGPLGLPGLGSRQTIGMMMSMDVVSFVRRFYCADRIVVSAAGCIGDMVFKQLERLFGNIPERALSRHEESKYCGVGLFQKEEEDQTHLIVGFPNFSKGEYGSYASFVFGQMIGGCDQSRLFKKIRQEHGLCYDVSFVPEWWRPAGLSFATISCGGDQAKEAIPLLCQELVKARDGLTDEELEIGKRLAIASVSMGLETTHSRAEAAGYGLAVRGKAYDPQEEIDLYRGVTHDDVSEVIERMTSAPPTIAISGPQEVLEMDIAGMLR